MSVIATIEQLEAIHGQLNEAVMSDRGGNNRVDSLRNIVRDPGIA